VTEATVLVRDDGPVRTLTFNRPTGKGRQMTHAVTIAKPVIAAINGPCAGLRLVQALACDIRFMAASAVATTSFTRRGRLLNFARVVVNSESGKRLARGC